MIRIRQGTFSTHLLLMALSWSDKEEYREHRYASARSIQRLIRGRQGRRRARWEKFKQRMNEKFAKKIQNQFWRKFLLKRRTVISLQAAFRGAQSRRTTDPILAFQRKKHGAARVIQFGWLRRDAKPCGGFSPLFSSISESLGREDIGVMLYPKVTRLLLRLRVKAMRRDVAREMLWRVRPIGAALDIQRAFRGWRNKKRLLFIARQEKRRKRRERTLRHMELIQMAREDRETKAFEMFMKRSDAALRVTSFARRVRNQRVVRVRSVMFFTSRLIDCIHSRITSEARLTASRLIRRVYRGYKARSRAYQIRNKAALKLAEQLKREAEQKRMLAVRRKKKHNASTVIQCFVRVRWAQRERERRKRGLMRRNRNLFGSLSHVSQVIADAEQRCVRENLCIPEEKWKGMGVFLWLFRLGCGPKVSFVSSTDHPTLSLQSSSLVSFLLLLLFFQFSLSFSLSLSLTKISHPPVFFPTSFSIFVGFVRSR